MRALADVHRLGSATGVLLGDDSSNRSVMSGDGDHPGECIATAQRKCKALIFDTRRIRHVRGSDEPHHQPVNGGWSHRTVREGLTSAGRIQHQCRQ